MAFWEQFPFTNFHEMNLEWLTKAMKELKEYVENYVAINKVSYAGIWDITKQYTQWSVVSTNEKTYMSKIAVPSGIAIDNGDYWIELADLDPRIGGLIASFDALTTRIDASVDALTTRIDALEIHNAVFIGDSYMFGTGGTHNIMPNMISKALGCTPRSFANGGSGFIRPGESGNFLTQIENANNDDSFNNDTVDYVVIAGGYNDMGALDKIEGLQNAAKNVCVKAHEYFPRAKVVCVCFPWINIPYNDTFANVSSRLTIGANDGGAKTVNALSWLLYLDNSYQSGDNIHPSNKGYELIARRIVATCNGSDPLDIYYGLANTPTYAHESKVKVVGWKEWLVSGTFQYDGTGDGVVFDLSNIRAGSSLNNIIVTLYNYSNLSANTVNGIIFEGKLTVARDSLVNGNYYTYSVSFYTN